MHSNWLRGCVQRTEQTSNFEILISWIYVDFIVALDQIKA